jgi:hypothetical protein
MFLSLVEIITILEEPATSIMRGGEKAIQGRKGAQPGTPEKSIRNVTWKVQGGLFLLEHGYRSY